MPQNDENFAGDKKVGRSILTRWETKIVGWAVPKVPLFIRTYHLTLATIPISLGIVLFSYMARFEINWLWLVSVFIFMQWVTDGLDGAVGRAREEGFIKWGYYMDHFLDYIFLCAILIGYMLLIPDRFKDVHFFVLAIFGAFMVNSYLAFAASNKFRIAYLGIGPTEIRLVFIVINTLIILFGKTYMVVALPYVLVFSFFGLCVVVYRTQKEIWEIDMAIKRKNQIEHGFVPDRKRVGGVGKERVFLEKRVEE
ncbi:MAG: CDP-alcohol phosphatidyltransferase family protein [Patescibacteria group bacterium]|nr:CDP-alcohol phosphatidyltransferase family protein [Patescibacteria group bacterium]